MPSFMNQIFEEKDTPYTIRSGRNILAPKPNTTGYGIENARFLVAKMAYNAIFLKRIGDVEYLQKRH